MIFCHPEIGPICFSISSSSSIQITFWNPVILLISILNLQFHLDNVVSNLQSHWRPLLPPSRLESFFASNGLLSPGRIASNKLKILFKFPTPGIGT